MLTPMQRPKEFGTKAVLTPEEAKKYREDSLGAATWTRAPAAARSDVERAYNDFWWDFGTTASHPDVAHRRSAGRPYAADDRRRRSSGSPQARPAGYAGPAEEPGPHPAGALPAWAFNCADRRCAPSAATTTTCRSCRRRDHVVILNEMVHDARIVPLDGRPHLPHPICVSGWATRAAAGRATRSSSRRRTSATTTSFRGSTRKPARSSSGSRAMDDEHARSISFTVDDPTTWIRPWTAAYPMATQPTEPIYEYACHEGNHGMEGISRAPAWTKQAAKPTTGSR